MALTGILFVLKSGIGWEVLPQELGCGSEMTYWRRLRAQLLASAQPLTVLLGAVKSRLGICGAQSLLSRPQWTTAQKERSCLGLSHVAEDGGASLLGHVEVH